VTGGPFKTPVVRVPAPMTVPVLRVAAPTMPGLVRSLIAGGIGPAGERGPQGVSGDYGYIRYDEDGAVQYPIPANADIPFTLVAPVMMTNTLRAPFDSVIFLDPDGKTVRARKSGDSYFIRVRLSVEPTVANGTFEVNLYVTGNTTGIVGASSTRPRIIPVAAGSTSRVDELFQVFPGGGFVANGALFMLRCSVNAKVTPEALFITPVVAA
jgi:hypothetical protein